MKNFNLTTRLVNHWNILKFIMINYFIMINFLFYNYKYIYNDKLFS